MSMIQKNIILSLFVFILFFFRFDFSAYCQNASKKSEVNNQQAREAPEWITRGIIYQINPRAFTEEGTLKSAASRLPDLARLGINIVYLCPVFVADDDMDQRFWSPRQKASGMNNPRNPYRMKDFYHVDPEYGTDNDLKDYIIMAHKLGLRVMLDMVYLHCGPTAVFLKDHPDFIKRDNEGKPVNAAWAFPALNYANPELREYLCRNMEYWVKDFDVDGFRCDVASGIPIDFWEESRDRLEKIRPDIGMLAEGERTVDQLKAFDLNYSFTWFNALRRVMEKGESASTLSMTWENMANANPKGSRFIRYTDNHDIANDAYHNRIEKTWGTKGVNAALVMTFTLDGVPFLYNGQEVADTARHSIFGRLPVNWEGRDTPAGKARIVLVKRLIKMRLAEPSLIRGTLRWIENNEPNTVVSYLREHNGEKILTVVNLSAKQVSLNKLLGIKTGSYKPLIEENIKGDIIKGFVIQPYGFWVGKEKNQ